MTSKRYRGKFASSTSTQIAAVCRSRLDAGDDPYDIAESLERVANRLRADADDQTLDRYTVEYTEADGIHPVRVYDSDGSSYPYDTLEDAFDQIEAEVDR